MANVQMPTYRGTTTYCNSIAKADGNLLFDTTTKDIYMDVGTGTNDRIKFTTKTTSLAASAVKFNNSGTGMSATKVQDAITELNSNLSSKPSINDISTTSTTDVWSAKKTYDNVSALDTQLSIVSGNVESLKSIGNFTYNSPYTGTIIGNSYCPNYLTIPSAGLWLITTGGYAAVGNVYMPFGIGTGNGTVRRGFQPSMLFEAGGNEKIYIWNIDGNELSAIDMTIYAVEIKANIN